MNSAVVGDSARKLQETPMRDSNGVNDIAAKSSGGDGRHKKKSRNNKYMPKFGCFRVENEKEGSFDIRVDRIGEPSNPNHLVVMVNGIIGSATDWKYGAKQLLRKYPRDIVVHCSKVNTRMLTLHGVDVMGCRLAEEVISVRQSYPSVQKISFVGHSLGGVIARYAIAKLYKRGTRKEISQGNGERKDDEFEETSPGKIAGLEPMNFITFATPHLGSRWHKQVPVFCGFWSLESLVARLSGFLGRTGKHLFLADGRNGRPPLLLQMVADSEDLKFISALESFKRRVAYANVRFDYLVGWSTSSLRHRTELPKRRHLSKDSKYPHIVHFDSSTVARTRNARVDGGKTTMEEEMLRGLTKVSWERVDVYFKEGAQRFGSHNTIQVNGTCMNSEGADVIQHMVDNFLL
ncbi:hypothetical protein K2173_007907 [Erythroxylum novogranatense]|uniref:DUF676 domain-containing protein n=1 Tax=Erythroxylum novogranatense TaxID=1862640 RepID=A0AAV8T8B5_9ROSI|nr:hypothetical protein K2173_007907 [Erythroxylum novogranatense]